MSVNAIIIWSVCFLAPIVTYILLCEIPFRKTTYYKHKGKGYFRCFLGNKGAYGEYLIYKNLRYYEQLGAKFLFNVYLPSQSRNVDTTEIDVLLITERGIYVFESKNYSGWIFGNDRQKMWTQCLPRGKGKKAQKESFFNPIWQNEAHIKALRNVLSNAPITVYSVVTFSDRCTFKNITLPNSTNVCIIKRGDAKRTIRVIEDNSSDIYSIDTVNSIYNTLLPYCAVSEEVKQQHITQINNINTPSK